MGKRTAGTVYIKVDGTQLVVVGSFEAPLSDVKRETLAKGGYFKEEDLLPYIKGDVLFTRDFPLDLLTSNIDMTVTLELKNGKTYVLSGAYVVNELAVSTDDGKVSIEWNGAEGSWI